MIWLLLGCGGYDQPPDPPPPRIGHFSGWEGLLRATSRGDVQTARIQARDLSLGSIPEDREGAEVVGAALGFLQVATSPGELGVAVSRAAAGCVACHRERGALPPPVPAAEHTTALSRAAWGAVWGQDALPPADAQLPREVLIAWAAPDRLRAVVAACQGCHPTP
ncbi:MAG TPA: hypothetical protein ENK18_15170 [Deltaproteobacteria bacterium]|nr:hypothetical protein [Deltaproteobacteria bacterium]